MEAGTYRYATFLARRIRRIFPALCTVLIATFIAGWLLLSQQELVALGNEIFAGSFFFANILYWSQLGYFDGAAEMKPAPSPVEPRRRRAGHTLLTHRSSG